MDYIRHRKASTKLAASALGYTSAGTPTHEPSIPTYPLPLRLSAPLPVPVCTLLSSNSLESTSAPSDPDAEPGKELVEGVNVAAAAGCGFGSGLVNVAELPVEVDADAGLLGMR